MSDFYIEVDELIENKKRALWSPYGGRVKHETDRGPPGRAELVDFIKFECGKFEKAKTEEEAKRAAEFILTAARALAEIREDCFFARELDWRKE